MSGELYGYVRIPSPEELARLEAERYRREAEQRLLIETEKTKIVLESLKKEREKRMEEERKAQKARQEEERRWGIERELFKDRTTIIKKDKDTRALSQEIKESSEKEGEVFSRLQSIELKISELDPAISELIKDKLMDIKNSLNEIRGKIHGNYSYFENIIKWLDIRLKEVITEGKKKLEAMKMEFNLLSEKAVELLTDIEMMINSPLLPDKGRALELKTALENALLERNTYKLKKMIETSTSKVKMLYNQYLEIEKLNDERRYIMESVQSVLVEMGYEVTKLPYKTAETPQAPLFMESNIPGGGGVRLGFGIDKGIFAEVFHPESEGGIDKEKFKTQEKKWCLDIDEIKAKLNEKGIVFEEKWRKDFKDEDIERILGESQIEEETEEEKMLLDDDDIRRMQR